MVWKCCVPGCTLSSKFPVHRFPSKPEKLEAWLKIIGKTDMLMSSKEVLAKLRICTEHFSEDIIKPYGMKRNLIDNAMPNRNLPQFNNNTLENNENNTNLPHFNNNILEKNDNANSLHLLNNFDDSNCNFDTNLQNLNIINENMYVENVQDKVNLTITSRIQRTVQQNRLQTIRRLKKNLYMKKIKLKRLQQKLKKLRCENTWENITENMTKTQKIFF
ncbi:putative uncharacterized protein DDB_G0286901 [Monomorium pharaonis]|uniref:putative uncharacterized protein DDB_G0286901 n=1 Tax=Monomorium pharaonis TaxID=307658 RepID=UPI0017464D70|nr:putative uncharacterized protein DDB_G0286901 [Monomorium pharaonis]